MPESNEEFQLLLQQVDELNRRQTLLQNEIEQLRLKVLKFEQEGEATENPEEKWSLHDPMRESREPLAANKIISDANHYEQKESHSHHEVPKFRKSNIEKFIGENLINKVGIAITVLGVAFGAKYAIDHGFLSPIVRVFLGYLLGWALMFTALRLKNNYKPFSAVLLGGAMAIFYLVSFSAYNYYQFFSQSFAFVLMVIITAATVYAALKYDLQVLAQIGLVGAYSVPFLLSDNSGRVVILFSYFALINTGILVIAFRKSWKFLFYSSFVITWLVFGLWSLMEKRSDLFGVGLFFLALHYLIFFITFMLPSFLQHQKIRFSDIVILLLNAVIVFCLGLEILLDRPDCKHCNGLFFLSNAAVPFVCYGLMLMRKVRDRDAEILLISLISIFFTLAINEFFDQQWITLGVGFFGLTYFLIGRLQLFRLLQTAAYPIIALSIFLLVENWITSNTYLTEDPNFRKGLAFMNLTFVTSIFITGIVYAIWRMHKLPDFQKSGEASELEKVIKSTLPLVLVALIYFTLRIEISAIWVQKFHRLNSFYFGMGENGNRSPHFFRKNELIFVLLYSLLFLSLLNWWNSSRIKSKEYGLVILGCSTIAILTFLTQGLLALRYLRYDNEELFQHFILSVNVLRYLSFFFVVLLLVTGHRHVKQSFFSSRLKVVFEVLLSLSVLWLSTSELFRILEMYDAASMYKLGLSILWGSFALLLIVIGIWRRLKHLRIVGMIIFGFTIFKLLLYDLDNLSTIAKAGLFILIGLFLLIVSFLYLRYKRKIFGDETT